MRKSFPLSVLLVEDNQLLRWWMTSSLERAGCSVTAPPLIDEILNIAGSALFDVLITDWRLAEGHDGLEVLLRVREKNPNTLAILISAEAGEEFTEQARAKGFDLVLEKPFEVAEIVGAVQSLTGTPRTEVVS